jgi:hypothetical protein
MSTEDQQDRRVARRFALHIPLTITAIGGVPSRRAGRSHDISTRGILFHTDGEIPLGTLLELVMVLPQEITGSDSIHVRCLGHVVRVAREPDGSSMAIAVSIEGQEYLLESELARLGAVGR